MNRIIFSVLIAGALVCGGCSRQSPSPSGAQSPHGGKDAAAGMELQPSSAHSRPAAAANGNPHPDISGRTSAGADHKGKVVSAVNASGYTYLEVMEGRNNIWVAVTQTDVKVGDEVEFPDSPPIENFRSKTLNRTFDRILFSAAIRVNGKPGQLAAHPKTS